MHNVNSYTYNHTMQLGTRKEEKTLKEVVDFIQEEIFIAKALVVVGNIYTLSFLAVWHFRDYCPIFIVSRKDVEQLSKICMSINC